MPARTGTKRKQRKQKPLVVTVGRTSVSIYPRPARGTRAPCWQVASYASGTRVLTSFRTEAAAKAEAARVAASMNALDHAGAALHGGDARDLVRARTALEGSGLDVVEAVDLLVALMREAGGRSNLAVAARDFARRNLAAPVAVADVVRDLLAAKEAKGASPRLLADYRHRLAKFAQHFAGRNIRDLTTLEVQGWVDGLVAADGSELAPQSRRNFAAVGSALFEFARKRGAILENPFRDIERERVRREDVAFWTPEECARLLAAMPAAALPAFVACLFGGIRSAEACRLSWAAVDLDAAHVAIGASVAKCASRRLVPLPPNAIAWLRPRVGLPDAPLFAGDAVAFARLVTEACTAAGARRIPNGARHSCISYKVAATQDVARVALESGNSAPMIHAHYRGLATAADAARFFAIMPPAKESGVRLVA